MLYKNIRCYCSFIYWSRTTCKRSDLWFQVSDTPQWQHRDGNEQEAKNQSAQPMVPALLQSTVGEDEEKRDGHGQSS